MRHNSIQNWFSIQNNILYIYIFCIQNQFFDWINRNGGTIFFLLLQSTVYLTIHWCPLSTNIQYET